MYKKEHSEKKFIKSHSTPFLIPDDENDIEDNLLQSVTRQKCNIKIEEVNKKPQTNSYKPKSYAGALTNTKSGAGGVPKSHVEGFVNQQLHTGTLVKQKTLAPVQQNHIINNIEDEMFKQYYGRKVYKNYDNKKINNDEDGFKQVSHKKEKQIVECKFKTMEIEMLDMSIGNYYKVLGHHNDDQNWDYISYHNICTITKWKDIPQLFNTLNKSGGECKYTDFDIFIMKNDISPMWEDIENRNGSICSIKVDSLKDGYKILKELLIYAANNTLMEFTPESWDKINGLSFSPKRMDNVGSDSSFCVIIKIWFKQNYGNNTNIDKYLNPNIQELLKRYSVKVKSIKPEY